MAVPEDQIEVSVLDCLRSQREADPIDLSVFTWQIAPNLDLAPSRADLSQFDTLEGQSDDGRTLLKRALQRSSSRYDLAIIDCPPQLGMSMRNALFAADEVIIPVETGYFSLHGLTRQLETMETFARENDKTFRTRVLANQYDVRTKLAREILAELRRKFEGVVMKSIINFNTKLKEGISFGQPITEYAPGSSGTRDFQAVARELLAREEAAAPSDALRRYADQIARDADRLVAGKVAVVPPAAPARPVEPVKTPVAAQPVAPVTAPAPAPVVAEPVATAALAPTATAQPVSQADTARVNHQRIDEKLERIYGVRQTPAGVVFCSNLPDARVVQLAGDFNDWMPHTTPMHRLDESGTFQTTLKLSPGRYRYRLVVDGRWAYDTQNPSMEKNEYGELNSVVDIS
jgi:chromosome partitioning protein